MPLGADDTVERMGAEMNAKGGGRERGVGDR